MPGPTARRACELRVHGVGGDPPQVVLGRPYREQVRPVWRTAGGRTAVLSRRDDADVRVFSWGELTSGSRWFALWTLLLPFTLANVAGWAEPRGLTRGRSLAVRAVVHLLALLLSAAALLWLSVAGVTRLPVPAGVGAAAVAMAVLVSTATCVAARFERFRPRGWPDHPPRRSWRADTDLADRAFFDNGADHTRRWHQHVAAVVAVAVAVGAVAGAGPDKATVLENLGWMTLGVTVAQLLLVGVLGALCWRRTAAVREWRWAAPAALAGGSVLTTGGVVSGALATAAGGPANLPAGPAFALLDVYAVAAGTAALALVVAAAVVLFRMSPAERTDSGVPEHERLLKSGKARRSARVVQLGRHADLAVTAFVAAFVAGGLGVALVRVVDGASAWRPEGNLLTRVSLAFLGVFVGVTIRHLRRNALNLEARRRVGQIWDVLTFWPRSFHPLAVRPYAERAVPELQEYLRTGGDGPPPDRWVVTAHSQGSVLAYAALRAAAATPAGAHGPLPPVDLVTFGSPLLNLYAKAFPRYFRRDDFGAVAVALAAAGGSWLNVFRATDPVGQVVFTGRWEDRDPRADAGLEDPNTRPPAVDERAPDLEQDLVVDGRVWGHSGYRRARPFKERVYQRLSRSGKEAPL